MFRLQIIDQTYYERKMFIFKKVCIIPVDLTACFVTTFNADIEDQNKFSFPYI